MTAKEGDRIELVAMPDDPAPIPVGTQGTVVMVTDLGSYTQLLVDWDIARNLNLVVPPDQYRVISKDIRLERDRARSAAVRASLPRRERS